MSASISFSNIPSNARVPLFHVEFDPSQAGIGQDVKRTLLIGVTLIVVPEVPVFVPSLEWAAAQYGFHSMLYKQIAAYRANDPVGELWALPVFANASGAAATGAIAFTGTATSAATIGVYVGGVPFYVNAAVGDTATVIGAALLAAAAAIPGAYPLQATFTASSGTVTVLADHKGLSGNDIDLRLNYRGASAGESLPAGITASITPMSGGTLDPSLASIGTEMGGEAFDYIQNPFRSSTSTTAMSAVMSNSAGRWSDNAQLYGHVFVAKVDTLANLVTYGGALNDPHLSVIGIYDTPTTPWEVGAACIGAMVTALNNDPARPVQTLPVLGILPPPMPSRFTKSGRQSLLTHGIATIVAHQDGSIAIERCITTSQTNTFGAPSLAYLDVETLYTLMAVTRDLRTYITTTFPRCKIVDDGTVIGPGSAAVTPKLLKSSMIARYKVLEQLGLVEAVDKFAAALIVQRNVLDSSRVDVLYAPYLVSGLRIFAVLNQFRLGG